LGEDPGVEQGVVPGDANGETTIGKRGGIGTKFGECGGVPATSDKDANADGEVDAGAGDVDDTDAIESVAAEAVDDVGTTAVVAVVPAAFVTAVAIAGAVTVAEPAVFSTMKVDGGGIAGGNEYCIVATFISVSTGTP